MSRHCFPTWQRRKPEMAQQSIGWEAQCEEVCENISAQYDPEALTFAESVIDDHIVACVLCRRYLDSLPGLQRRLQLDHACDVDRLWHGIQTELRRSE